MKRLLTVIMLLMLACSAGAQNGGPGYYRMYSGMDREGLVFYVDLWPIPVFSRPADLRKYNRLVEYVKIVYPIARTANRMLHDMEAHLLSLDTQRERDAYTKQVEKNLKEEYTPVLRRMTFSQGKILIKLIDRETSRTSCDLVRQFRGAISATLWQGVARIFGANLKDTYDKDGEDAIIEQIITLYEMGLI